MFPLSMFRSKNKRKLIERPVLEIKFQNSVVLPEFSDNCIGTKMKNSKEYMRFEVLMTVII
jgi:hypothetical protein